MSIVDRGLFRRIEAELYNYKANTRELEEAREEILQGTEQPAAGRGGGGVSDPTLIRVMRLAQLADTDQGRWVTCIDTALAMMADEQRRLVRCKYMDKLSVDQIADELNISRSLYFIWRERVVLHVAVLASQLGLVGLGGRGQDVNGVE